MPSEKTSGFLARSNMHKTMSSTHVCFFDFGCRDPRSSEPAPIRTYAFPKYIPRAPFNVAEGEQSARGRALIGFKSTESAPKAMKSISNPFQRAVPGAVGKYIPRAPFNVADGKKSACRHALNGFKNIEITPLDDKQNFQPIPESGARGQSSLS